MGESSLCLLKSEFCLNMATGDSTDVGAATTNMISGTITQGLEVTGSLATNRSVINRLTNSMKFIQERKWMQTCRGIPEFISPIEFSRPSASEIWKRLSANTTYFFTNCYVFY